MEPGTVGFVVYLMTTTMASAVAFGLMCAEGAPILACVVIAAVTLVLMWMTRYAVIEYAKAKASESTREHEK